MGSSSVEGRKDGTVAGGGEGEGEGEARVARMFCFTVDEARNSPLEGPGWLACCATTGLSTSVLESGSESESDEDELEEDSTATSAVFGAGWCSSASEEVDSEDSEDEERKAARRFLLRFRFLVEVAAGMSSTAT